jgi:hypothetical protein
MTHRTAALLLLFIAVLAVAPATRAATFEFQDGATVELDGRYYVMLAGTITTDAVLGYTVNAPLGISNCTRPGGQGLVLSQRPLRWNGGQNTIWLTLLSNADGSTGIQVRYPFDRAILRMVSSTGDLICSGEVPAPPGLDTVFRSGFE